MTPNSRRSSGPMKNGSIENLGVSIVVAKMAIPVPRVAAVRS